MRDVDRLREALVCVRPKMLGVTAAREVRGTWGIAGAKSILAHSQPLWRFISSILVHLAETRQNSIPTSRTQRCHGKIGVTCPIVALRERAFAKRGMIADYPPKLADPI